MADTLQIRKLKDSSFSISNNKNLIDMLGVGYEIHKQILIAASKEDGKIYLDGEEFSAFINRMLNSKKKVIISQSESEVLNEWLHCLCQMLIAAENVDYTKKDIKKFLRLSQEFVKKTGTKITENKKQ